MGSEEAYHVILFDAVARYTDAADEPVAAIDGDRSRKDLNAVLQPVLPRRDIGQRRAALWRVGGDGARHEAEMLAEIADNQRRLEPGGQRIELCDRARHRPVRPPDLYAEEHRVRRVGPRTGAKSGWPGPRPGTTA